MGWTIDQSPCLQAPVECPDRNKPTLTGLISPRFSWQGRNPRAATFSDQTQIPFLCLTCGTRLWYLVPDIDTRWLSSTCCRGERSFFLKCPPLLHHFLIKKTSPIRVCKNMVDFVDSFADKWFILAVISLKRIIVLIILSILPNPLQECIYQDRGLCTVIWSNQYCKKQS